MNWFTKFWYFRVKNPVVRRGEQGAFRWRFRRFWLEIETLSGNFKAKWMADKNPYAYLLAGKDDENIAGFCRAVYMLSTLLTTDKGFVDDIQKAIDKYEKRLNKQAAKEAKVEDETEEKAAIEWEKQVQEYVEMPRAERRRKEKSAKKEAKNG